MPFNNIDKIRNYFKKFKEVELNFSYKFVEIKSFYERGLYTKSLELINELEEKEKLIGFALKITILTELGKYSEVGNLIKTVSLTNESDIVGNIHFNLAKSFYLIKINKFTESLEIIEAVQSQIELNKSLKKTLTENLANVYRLKGLLTLYESRYKGEIEDTNSKIIEYHQKSLEIFETIGNLQGMGRAYGNLGRNLTYIDLKLAEENLEKSLAIRMELDHKTDIAGTLSNLGILNISKGNIQSAYDYMSRSLEIRKDLGNEDDIAYTHMILSISLFYLGKLNESIESVDIGLAIAKKNKNTLYYKLGIFSKLVLVSFTDNITELKHLIDEFQFVEIDKAKGYNKIHIFTQALILKKAKRATSIAKAQEYFKEIALYDFKNFSSLFSLNFIATLHLIEMLLKELEETGEASIIDEIYDWIEKLKIFLSKKLTSIVFTIKSEVLQAKVALFELDIIKAKKYLSSAFVLAKENNINTLMIEITNEQDKLANDLEKFKSLISENAPIKDRINHSGLNSLFDKFAKEIGLNIENIELQEDPYLFLIVNEAGICVYSYDFNLNNSTVNEQLIGGYLSAINSFSKEAFGTSGSLERLKYNDLMLLLEPTDSLLYCYAFKGHSFNAVNKLKKFSNELKNKPKFISDIKSTSRSYNNDPTLNNLVNVCFISS